MFQRYFSRRDRFNIQEHMNIPPLPLIDLLVHFLNVDNDYKVSVCVQTGNSVSGAEYSFTPVVNAELNLN